MKNIEKNHRIKERRCPDEHRTCRDVSPLDGFIEAGKTISRKKGDTT